MKLKEKAAATVFIPTEFISSATVNPSRSNLAAHEIFPLSNTFSICGAQTEVATLYQCHLIPSSP